MARRREQTNRDEHEQEHREADRDRANHDRGDDANTRLSNRVPSAAVLLRVWDDHDRELTFVREPRRIVSLVPSETLTLFAQLHAHATRRKPQRLFNNRRYLHLFKRDSDVPTRRKILPFRVRQLQRTGSCDSHLATIELIAEVVIDMSTARLAALSIRDTRTRLGQQLAVNVKLVACA